MHKREVLEERFRGGRNGVSFDSQLPRFRMEIREIGVIQLLRSGWRREVVVEEHTTQKSCSWKSPRSKKRIKAEGKRVMALSYQTGEGWCRSCGVAKRSEKQVHDGKGSRWGLNESLISKVGENARSKRSEGSIIRGVQADGFKNWKMETKSKRQWGKDVQESAGDGKKRQRKSDSFFEASETEEGAIDNCEVK